MCHVCHGTTIVTRDEVTIIVPNSERVTEAVIMPAPRFHTVRYAGLLASVDLSGLADHARLESLSANVATPPDLRPLASTRIVSLD